MAFNLFKRKEKKEDVKVVEEIVEVVNKSTLEELQDEYSKIIEVNKKMNSLVEKQAELLSEFE